MSSPFLFLEVIELCISWKALERIKLVILGFLFTLAEHWFHVLMVDSEFAVLLWDHHTVT